MTTTGVASAAAASSLVPVAAMSTAQPPVSNVQATTKKDKKPQELLMVLKILQGKSEDIKLPTPYMKATFRNSERIANIVTSMINDVTNIEAAEIAILTPSLKNLGSPRDSNTSFDGDKIKTLGDITVPFLVEVIRKYSHSGVPDSAIKILCHKSTKNFFIAFEYLTGISCFILQFHSASTALYSATHQSCAGCLIPPNHKHKLSSGMPRNFEVAGDLLVKTTLAKFIGSNLHSRNFIDKDKGFFNIVIAGGELPPADGKPHGIYAAYPSSSDPNVVFGMDISLYVYNMFNILN